MSGVENKFYEVMPNTITDCRLSGDILILNLGNNNEIRKLNSNIKN